MNMNHESSEMIDVWLDCDPGLDDVFAIVMAVGHPKINLLGVSTTSGNSTIENTTRNASNVLGMLGKDNIPVYMGSKSSTTIGPKLGQDSHGAGGLGGV